MKNMKDMKKNAFSAFFFASFFFRKKKEVSHGAAAGKRLGISHSGRQGPGFPASCSGRWFPCPHQTGCRAIRSELLI